MYSPEDFEIINQHKMKEMKALFRSAFTSLCRLKLKNIKPKLEVDFKSNAINFDITVFREGGGNCTLDFYFFQDLKKVKTNLDGLLKIIKSDNFAQVESYIDNCIFL